MVAEGVSGGLATLVERAGKGVWRGGLGGGRRVGRTGDAGGTGWEGGVVAGSWLLVGELGWIGLGRGVLVGLGCWWVGCVE